MTVTQARSDSLHPSSETALLDSTLKEGDRGTEINRLQQLLNAQGANLCISGTFDRATKTAVKRFQQTHGLLPNGIIDSSTRLALLQAEPKLLLTSVADNYNPHDSLHQVRTLDWLQHEISVATMMEFNYRWADQPPPPEPMLYPGDRNKSVKALKQLLYRRDSLITVNDENEIDNYFDPLTQIAIIRFQHQQNLTGDGIVGPLTWRALRCPTRIMRLAKRLNAYRPAAHPCQKAALIWLQSQLPDAVLLEFSLRWHHEGENDVVTH